MSIHQVTDQDVEDFFASRSDPLFESFFDSNFSFDFGILPESFESSDSSASAETQLFDELSTGSSATSLGLTDFSPSSAFDLVLRPAHASHKEAPPTQLTNGTPRSRKLVHRLRPDGPGISGSELLSLEGQPQPKSIVANGQSRAHAENRVTHYPLTSTPPITPNPQRVRPRTSTSPIRKQRVPTKRSKSQSTKVATAAVVAAAAAESVPDIPYATIRRHRQTMLHAVEHTTSFGMPHQPTKLPPSPPASSRFPLQDHDSTSSMSSNSNGGTMSSAASVQPSPVFQDHGFETMNYAEHCANAFAPSTGSGDLAMLSLPWPTTQPQPDPVFSLYPSWDSTAMTPVFDGATSLYDMPFLSATESNNPYSFETSLASSGLMIQCGDNGDGYANSHLLSKSFEYPTYPAHKHSSANSLSSVTLVAPNQMTKASYTESEPPMIKLPKRGSASSSTPTKSRRGTNKHIREPSRPEELAKNSASPAGVPSSSTGRGQNPQHGTSRSIGSISGRSTAGSIRAHKSTGCLASSASTTPAKTTGSKTLGGKGADKTSDALPSGTMGFVNYTPSDSRKILTGVAPSGSSKTKARREREAVERRRRLSEAAAKAVREAGGDLEGLKREGVFEEELLHGIMGAEIDWV